MAGSNAGLFYVCTSRYDLRKENESQSHLFCNGHFYSFRPAGSYFSIFPITRPLYFSPLCGWLEELYSTYAANGASPWVMREPVVVCSTVAGRLPFPPHDGLPSPPTGHVRAG